jgi:hypothetical protein
VTRAVEGNAKSVAGGQAQKGCEARDADGRLSKFDVARRSFAEKKTTVKL